MEKRIVTGWLVDLNYWQYCVFFLFNCSLLSFAAFHLTLFYLSEHIHAKVCMYIIYLRICVYILFLLSSIDSTTFIGIQNGYAGSSLGQLSIVIALMNLEFDPSLIEIDYFMLHLCWNKMYIINLKNLDFYNIFQIYS